MTAHRPSIRMHIRCVFALLLCLVPSPGHAATGHPSSDIAHRADSAYHGRDYTLAAALYGQIVEEHPSATALYNLGNAQWRLRDTARAVCSYRRALLLDPSHTDARFNLQLCSARLQDQFKSPSQMFFTSLLSDCIDGRSAITWGWWALIGFFCSLVGWGMTRRLPGKWGRRAGRTVCWGGLLACLLLNLFAAWRSHTDSTRHYAVISATQSVYAQPHADAAVRRPLHTGTTVQVLETRHGGWQQIEMPDGETGWICGQTLPVK